MEEKSSNERKVILNDYQDSFIFDNEHKFHFLKSAWGTGKSYALIIAGIEECKAYPNNLGVIFRKEYTDLRDSTCIDFESFSGLKISAKRDIRIKSRTGGRPSTILFRHLEELNNIQNMNLGWFGIEQAEELDTDKEFFTLFGRLRRKGCSLKGYIISNAKGHNWIYKIKQKGLYDPAGKRLDLHLSATTFDNKHNLSPEFLNSLEVLKSQKPQLYNRFVLNSDDDEDTIDIVIKPVDVRRAIRREQNKHEVKIRRGLFIDPARYGDDETVMYVFENNRLLAAEYYHLKNTMEVVGFALILAEKHKCNTIGVDVIGLGAGIVDRLREINKYKIIEINSAARATEPERYYNVRSEMWSKTADKFFNDLPTIPDDETLIEQLSAVRYKTIKSNGLLQIEPKEEVKKRLGRSPDRADCCVMGLHFIDQCQPVEIRDRYSFGQDRKKPYKFNSENC